jgi:outer membrane protein TolC
MAWIFHLVLAVLPPYAFAQTAPVKPFSTAINEVMKSPDFEATNSEIQAIQLDFASRELVLQPLLSLNANRANDNREVFSTIPGQGRQQKPRIDTVSVTLSKPFSTGTTVSITPSWQHALTPAATPDQRYTSDWNIAISQNLWKDFLGRSTTLRRRREDFERKQQLALAMSKRGQVLVDFETLYWDWALALRQKELQEKNLKRSREILKWTQDRYNRAAAESTDLLQAKALLTQREVQLTILQQTLTQAITNIKRYFPGADWIPNSNDLHVARTPEALAQEWKADDLNEVSQLDYLAAKNEAGAAEQSALEARESIRPNLTLNLTYGKNALDTTADDSIHRSLDETHEYSAVGVTFSTGLDLGNEYRKVDSARAAEKAAKQRREAREDLNKVAWKQLKQELRDLEEQAEKTKQLVTLQLKKSDAERDRYRKGRTTAFEAITFEQEASEAEITLWQLYALIRKTEARARLFAR